MFQANRICVIPAVYAFIIFMISACGSTDGSTPPSLPSIQESTVLPLYGVNGANWNDYVRNDGADIYSSTDSVCDPTIDTACLHGGQMLSMEVPGQNVCNNLTAADQLSIFEWECDDTVTPVRFISKDFNGTKGLSDLIDFDTSAFKDNYLEVWKSGIIVANSSPSIWWDNDIVTNNDGSDGTDMLPGEIHILTQNANATYTIGVDRVALIVKPGVTLTGSSAIREYLLYVNNNNFIWVEGMFDATRSDYSLRLETCSFSVLRNVTYSNAITSGISLNFSSNNNRLNNIIVNRNGSHGIAVVYSSNNSLKNIVANENSVHGVYLYGASHNNSLSQIAASGNSSTGVRLESASNCNLSQITSSGNGHNGVRLDSLSNCIVNQITSSGNGNYGILIFAGRNNTLSQINANGNVSTGFYLLNSTDNILSQITASGNASTGLELGGSSHNILSQITASENADTGVYLISSTDNSLSQLTTSNNISSGVYIASSSNNNTLGHITSSDNYYGIRLYNVSNNKFTHMLQVGNNTSSDCFVLAGTEPGLIDGTCSDTGIDGSNTYGTNSSDALLTTNISVLTSFVNPASYDFSLLATDSVIRDQLGLPTGADNLTHTWSDSSTTEILRTAVEVMDDSIGNDNLLCESNETCLYTPNISAYQGHGDLVSAGTFTDGTITGVTLMRYEMNGY